MEKSQITDLAKSIYNCASTATKYELTQEEESIVEDYITDSFKLQNNGKYRIIFKNNNSVIKIPRNTEYNIDSIDKNKREVMVSREYYSMNIFNEPLDYHKDYLWVEYPYYEPLIDQDMPDMKKTQILTYLTDELESIDSINPYNLRKEHIGYNADKQIARIIDYGFFDISDQ